MTSFKSAEKETKQFDLNGFIIDIPPAGRSGPNAPPIGSA